MQQLIGIYRCKNCKKFMFKKAINPGEFTTIVLTKNYTVKNEISSITLTDDETPTHQCDSVTLGKFELICYKITNDGADLEDLKEKYAIKNDIWETFKLLTYEFLI